MESTKCTYLRGGGPHGGLHVVSRCLVGSKEARIVRKGPRGPRFKCLRSKAGQGKRSREVKGWLAVVWTIILIPIWGGLRFSFLLDGWGWGNFAD